MALFNSLAEECLGDAAPTRLHNDVFSWKASMRQHGIVTLVNRKNIFFLSDFDRLEVIVRYLCLPISRSTVTRDLKWECLLNL